MKYKLLKETPFDKSGAELFLYEAWGNYASHNSYLVDGKSYPKDVVENNPEWFCPIDSTCEKCGETEGIELCPKCGAESYGNCPCKPKEEKIEIKLPNLNIKLPREILDPDSGHTEEFRHWAVQMTTSVNKLNKGDN